jgi:hypothetical protein
MRFMALKNSKAGTVALAMLGLIDDIVISLCVFQATSLRKTDGATIQGATSGLTQMRIILFCKKDFFSLRHIDQSSKRSASKMAGAIFCDNCCDHIWQRIGHMFACRPFESLRGRITCHEQ